MIRRLAPLACAAALSVGAALAIAPAAQADATPVSLGSAASFGVLGSSTVTSTGNTRVNGDLGLYPGTSVTGFPPGVVNGDTHIADSVALQAQNDAQAAYNAAAAEPDGTSLTGQDLGGMTLPPGVYNFASSAGLTGTLVLDGQGDPDSVFIIQVGSTLTTASSSDVRLINGAKARNVIWQIGSSATLGTYSTFNGNILAYASITETTGVKVHGLAAALTAAVTLDDNKVTAPAPALR